MSEWEIEDKTCGNCEYEKVEWNKLPCRECIKNHRYDATLREDLWEEQRCY